jgi:pilus assembly protein Flp/PilA
MMTKIMNFLKDEEGATMVEYALMLGLIAIVSILAVTGVGNETNQTFTKIEGELGKVPN